MQFAYEDRIAELRAQVDRITSRQLLDQEQFEQKLEQVMRKQGVLEQRAATLSSFPDMTPPARSRKADARAEAPKGNAPPKPSPINDTIIFQAPGDREARLESRALPVFNLRNAGQDQGRRRGCAGAHAGIARQTRIQASLRAQRDGGELSIRERAVSAACCRISASIRGKTPPASSAAGAVGGPFVAAQSRFGEEKCFERQLYRIHISRAQFDELTRTLSDVPRAQARER